MALTRFGRSSIARQYLGYYIVSVRDLFLGPRRRDSAATIGRWSADPDQVQDMPQKPRAAGRAPALALQQLVQKRVIRMGTQNLSHLANFLRDKLVTLAVMLAGILALGSMCAYVTPTQPTSARSALSSSGVPSRVEVSTIYLPPEFVALCKLPPGAAEIQSHDGLRVYLEDRGMEVAWYAITTQSFGPGAATTLTSFCRPFDSPDRFEQFLDVLATAAGDPPSYPGTDYSTARIVVMPDEIARSEPAEAMAKLPALRATSSPGDR